MTAQGAQALGKVLYISLRHSHCIRSRGDPAPAGRSPFTALLNRLRIGLMTGDDVQCLNTRVGATPAAAAMFIHGTTMDAVQPATPQTPTTPALEPLPPMGMTAPRSAINDIAGLTDGQLPYILPQSRVLSVTLLNR